MATLNGSDSAKQVFRLCFFYLFTYLNRLDYFGANMSKLKLSTLTDKKAPYDAFPLVSNSGF